MPVVVEGPIAYVEPATPSNTKFPVPTFIAVPLIPVVLPIVMTFAIAVPMFIAPVPESIVIADAPV